MTRTCHAPCSPQLAACLPAGSFTNQIQKYFEEPRVLIATDPRTDAQPVREASFASIVTIALADSDAPLEVRRLGWAGCSLSVLVCVGGGGGGGGGGGAALCAVSPPCALQGCPAPLRSATGLGRDVWYVIVGGRKEVR